MCLGAEDIPSAPKADPLPWIETRVVWIHRGSQVRRLPLGGSESTPWTEKRLVGSAARWTRSGFSRCSVRSRWFSKPRIPRGRGGTPQGLSHVAYPRKLTRSWDHEAEARDTANMAQSVPEVALFSSRRSHQRMDLCGCGRGGMVVYPSRPRASLAMSRGAGTEVLRSNSRGSVDARCFDGLRPTSGVARLLRSAIWLSRSSQAKVYGGNAARLLGF